MSFYDEEKIDSHTRDCRRCLFVLLPPSEASRSLLLGVSITQHGGDLRMMC